MPTFKVTTKNGTLTVESERYTELPAGILFFNGEDIVAVIYDVQSIEKSYPFKEWELVNCCGTNGIVSIKEDMPVIDFGKQCLFITKQGSVKGYEHTLIQRGHVDPKFKLHDRVMCGDYKGVVTSILDGHLYCIQVTLDMGGEHRFTGDGRSNITSEPTLSLVTPNWTGLELEYYNALIEAGASESAADYAVSMSLASEAGLRSDYYDNLSLGFSWYLSPWSDNYWSNICAVIKTPPSVKLRRLFSDKTPEIGDLVIAGDVKGLFWYVGVFTSKNDTFFPYYVQNVGCTAGSWFKYIKCLNL